MSSGNNTSGDRVHLSAPGDTDNRIEDEISYRSCTQKPKAMVFGLGRTQTYTPRLRYPVAQGFRMSTGPILLTPALVDWHCRQIGTADTPAHTLHSLHGTSH